MLYLLINYFYQALVFKGLLTFLFDPIILLYYLINEFTKFILNILLMISHFLPFLFKYFFDSNSNNLYFFITFHLIY